MLKKRKNKLTTSLQFGTVANDYLGDDSMDQSFSSLRKATGLSVLAAAEFLGISIDAANAYESGSSSPKVNEKLALNGLMLSGLTPAKGIESPKSPRKLKALSFFSGAMGLDLGFEQAGIEVVLACEFDKQCRQTIAANRPKLPLLGNILDYSVNDVRLAAGLNENEEIDIVFGGPPCQAFSTAGARKGFNDPRGNVFLKFINLILELQPRYAVIENVRGLLSAPLNHRPHSKRGNGQAELEADELAGGALNYILNLLRGGGYEVSFNLYNTANYGVPQSRERVVLICHKGGTRVPFLAPTHSEDGKFGLPNWKTLRDALQGLDSSTMEFVTFPENRLKYYRMLKAGQYWKHLPTEMQKEAMGKSFFSGGGKTGFYRRLNWDRPSCTLVTHPAMPATDICHPTEDRPLSIEEYKRIQQFPDGWFLSGKLVDQYRQVGNAVPVSFGAAIARTIINHIENKSQSVPLFFPFSRYKYCDDKAWQMNTHTTTTRKLNSTKTLKQMDIFAAS